MGKCRFDSFFGGCIGIGLFFWGLCLESISVSAQESASVLSATSAITHNDDRITIPASLFIDSRLIDYDLETFIQSCFDFAASKLAKNTRIQLSLDSIYPWTFNEAVDHAFHEVSGNTDYSKWSHFMDEMDNQLHSLQPDHSKIRLAFIRVQNNAGKTRNNRPNAYIFTNGQSEEITQTMLVHEITHLFGTFDLIHTGTLMDEDLVLNEQKIKEHPPEFEPDNVEIINLAVEEYLKNGKLGFYLPYITPEIAEKAIPHFNALIPLAREPFSIPRDIGMYHYVQRKFPEATKDFERSIALIENATSSSKHSYLKQELQAYIAKSCFFNREFEKGLEAYRQAFEGTPETIDQYETMAIMHSLKNEIDSLISCYRKMVQLRPDYGQGWFYLGVSLLTKIPVDDWKSEALEEAQDCFEKAIHYQFEAGHPALGLILLKQGNTPEALPHLLKAKETGYKTIGLHKLGGDVSVNLETMSDLPNR